MNESKDKPNQFGEGFIAAIAVGFTLLLIGTIFVITPNLFNATLDFLKNFELSTVPHTDMILPVPTNPAAHLTVYRAFAQFSIAICLFQIFILALRFFVTSTWSKRAETVGNFVFWGGTAFLVQTYLIESTQWFVYWSTIIILIGVSLLARAIVIAVSRI